MRTYPLLCATWLALVVGTHAQLQSLASGHISVETVVDAAKEVWAYLQPGGKLHPAYFLEHKGHLVIEGVLVFVILSLFVQRAFKPKSKGKTEAPLTEKEIDMLCKEWIPEPLVTPLTEDETLPEPPVIDGVDGIYVSIQGRRVLNLGSADVYALASDREALSDADSVITKYGVGSCGPRGFYGTFDVHLNLEKELEDFMGTEEAIIYSYDIATVASVIPAFANRKDLLIVDEKVSYPVQQGCDLSRAQVIRFKHNDVADLERILRQQEERDKRERKPLNRRFVIVEGLYAASGEIAPLDRIVQLKERYKYRLVVEESYSFGVMGPTGRGACEHYGLRPDQVEVICASMATSLASVGGFCAGNREMIDAQRLSGLGYCFSASQPPYLATAASLSLKRIQQNAAQWVPRLAAVASALRRELSNVQGLKVLGLDVSPLIHVALAQPSGSAAADARKLQALCDVLLQEHNLLVCASRYSNLERQQPAPSIRLFANIQLSDKDVAAVGAAFAQAAKKVL